MKSLCIVSRPDELEQGLFGMVFYYAFQILPYLHAEQIYPQWKLRTLHYADSPEFLTIPGVLDLAYEPPSGPYREVSISEMRRRHAHILGNDWVALHRLWSSYFKTPQRVLEQADRLFPQGRVLGIHYRGTDKQTTSWDSNPISYTQFLTLLRDFLDSRPGEFDSIFAATDEYAFVEALRQAVDVPVLALGAVEFHMHAEATTPRAEKADRAMLDCVLLSRCRCVVETSSALPSYAKVLNPELEIYRCAASKLFGKLYTGMPYFPVAHLPVLPVRHIASEEILRQTIASDWSLDENVAEYRERFVAVPRWPRNDAAYRVAERWGLEGLASKVVRGYR